MFTTTFMAAHEVRSRERLSPLFAQVARLLKPGGRFLFADFYATGPEHAGLYLSRQAQGDALLACGFQAGASSVTIGGATLVALLALDWALTIVIVSVVGLVFIPVRLINMRVERRAKLGRQLMQELTNELVEE